MTADGLVALAGVVVAGLAAGAALHEDQDQDEAQQQGGELGRRRRRCPARYQVRKIPVVKVATPKYWTVP